MLDYRLKDESEPDTKTSDSVPQSQPNFWQRLRQSWENLNFRTKLVIFIVGSTTLPVIVVTQGLVTVSKDRALSQLKASLEQDGKSFASEYILWTQVDNQTKAENLAAVVEATEINLSNPAKVLERRTFLQNFLKIKNGIDPEINKNFQIFTDAQGRTVAQDIQILAQDLSNSPSLPAKDTVLTEPKYVSVSLPVGINLGNIPIVKNTLSTGRPLSGIELLKRESLQRLGLEKQADIGLRLQPVNNLAESQQPSPQGTYEIDGGKAGLTSIAVYPIKIKNKLVGTVIVGSLLNRNYGLVDKFSQSYNQPVATVFAQDWRVSTNVPYTDGKTRAVGTRVAREVAEKVLNQKQDFSGKTNIVGQAYLTFYTPLYDHQKELNPSQAKPVGIAFVGKSLEEVENPLRREQLIAYSVGGGILLVVVIAAIPLSGTFSRPLRRLANFAKAVADGEQGLRLENTERQDEIGILSQELNQMAVSIEANFKAQRQDAERAKLVRDIALRFSQSLNLQNIFNTAVEEIRFVMKADRVLVYSFDSNWKGTVSFESVGEEWPRALAAMIDDPCFAERYVERYRQGRVQAIDNIYTVNLDQCYLQQLEAFAVKANLVAPIVKDKELLGLLIAHQCSGPRAWQESEIELFSQLAAQVGFALERADFLDQQKAAREQLQRRALELLMEVDPVSKGDLTVRANVTEDEIGTIADSYNSTIASLRKIVTQVQTAATQVATTTSTNEASISGLSQDSLRQSQEIASALERIQEMSGSIRAVAISAQEAEVAVQEATQVVADGDAAMNRTVNGIMAIRETVAETSKKVRQLGESSQRISKVVNLISRFAAQTNLLALKASIEAARAGEEGRGFAVLADEVRTLANQSAQATAEIESLVAAIQAETKEVVAAMEAGTGQVADGTRLVDETRQSLNKITAVSFQISKLVEAIATSATVQSQVSESVTQTMSDVAAIASKNSSEVTQVSSSFQELLSVATQLQSSASQFKVS